MPAFAKYSQGQMANDRLQPNVVTYSGAPSGLVCRDAGEYGEFISNPSVMKRASSQDMDCISLAVG